MTRSDQTPRMSRRAFLRGMSVASGMLLANASLAACGGSPAAPAGEAGNATAAPAAGAATAAPAAGAATAAPAASSSAVKLELWTFVNTHARWFRAMAEDYKKNVNPNFELTVTEIAYQDMHDKLQIALQSGGSGAPDLADIEQGRFGGFLRSEDPGLVDLTERLKPYQDKLVAARQALYTYQGKTYGIEHALTPVVLYYRADVWEGAGADPIKFNTWDDFLGGAKQVTKNDVKAISFPSHETLLRQRGGDYFDKDGQVTLDSNLSIETMNWIVDLRDKYNVAAQAPDGDAYWAAIKAGKFLSAVGADWFAGFFKDNAPDLKGKWKAVPLPAFQAGGLRTSCLGGTGNCIVKTSKNIEEAWKFQQYTMLSPDANARRYELTNLFPPLIPAMTDPRLHKPDEYFSNQDLGKIFADLAPNVPPQYQSPFRAEMNSKLTALWQDIYDGKSKPADAFKQVADEIRTAMAAK